MEANNGVIFVGQTITIPKPGTVLPTTTPIPADLPRGRLIEYRVLPGDTLAGIAVKFNSLPDNIITENKIERCQCSPGWTNPADPGQPGDADRDAACHIHAGHADRRRRTAVTAGRNSRRRHTCQWGCRASVHFEENAQLCHASCKH